MNQTCTEKLLFAMSEVDAPIWLQERARTFSYHDFKSQSATPCIDLVRDLAAARSMADKQIQRDGLEQLRQRAMQGEFDATKEEADEWARSMANDPKMGPLLKRMGLS